MGEACKYGYHGESHVFQHMIRSTLRGEMYNIQAAAEGGNTIRAAIAHIDNKLGQQELFTIYKWESQSAVSVRDLWLTDCDNIASSLHNAAKPSGQDKRLKH